jgi:endonuclease YncB( thermonuclease family)
MAPSAATYHALREQIEAILTEGRGQQKQAGEWEKVETYWFVGDASLNHIGNQLRADYGEGIVANLSGDIGLSRKVLWDLLRFRRALPILASYRQLGWSHIRLALPLPNTDQRRYYLQRANAEAWSVRQLREAISVDAYGMETGLPWVAPLEEEDEVSALRARFGELWTTRLVSDGRPLPADSPESSSGRLALDLGFHTSLGVTELSQLDAPSDGLVVTSSPVAKGGYSFTPRTRSTRRYTYVSWVSRVIDGDTLVADVDLGFGCQARQQRFRLRGIDCPELRTLAGRNARAYVEEQLSAVDFIVITTHRTDAYGRYLADVRYLAGETDAEVVRRRGTYLNRALLDQRLARRYT